MNINKKQIIAIIIIVAIAAAGIIVYNSMFGKTVEGAKAITVEVVHKDGSVKKFECHTDAEHLDSVLVDNNIVPDQQGAYGLFFDTADGEKADYSADQSYWALIKDGEELMVGASDQPIADGETYQLVYTIYKLQ